MNKIDWIERARSFTPDVRNWLDGRRQAEGNGALLDKYSPRDGSLLYRLRTSTESEVDAAVDSSRRAFRDGRWSRMRVQARKDVLFRLAALLETYREELALLECLDVGKPIADAFNADVPAAAASIRFSAEAADKFYGSVYSADAFSLSYDLRRPVGVVAGIIGWNFPLCLAAQKIGPVLATGNSLVLKPSELTSLSASRVAELALEAGVPEGVFNVVHGDSGTGDALARHSQIDFLTFTGSCQTGKRLLVASGQSNMKRLLLECGSKAPNIVFEDSPDLDLVADAIGVAAFWNQGQVCVASSRLLVQESVREELLKRLARRIASQTAGDPLQEDTKHGALVSEAHRHKILAYIASAGRRDGRRVYTSGGASPFEHGFYLPQTIFADVSSPERIAQEEIFGPVLSVLSFRDEQEAIHIANDTTYGLSAVMWTRDVGRGHRVAQSLDAGWVVVNATGKPSGGPAENVLHIGGHKQSGIGAEGGIEGLRAYTTQTAIQMFV